jgi:hypothetical protein
VQVGFAQRLQGNDLPGKDAINNGSLSEARVFDGRCRPDWDRFSHRKSRIMRSTMTVVIALSCSWASAGADTPSAPNHHLRQLRFSPNGRYVLAQEDCWVTILTAKPLTVLFRAPAENAGSAEFTPDSQNVIFVTLGRYVERWDVVNKTRIDRVEVKLPPCKTEKLSPEGHVVACVDSDGKLTLADLVTGDVIAWKLRLGTRSIDYARDTPRVSEPMSTDTQVVTYSGELGSARIAFSPDGRFLIAVPVVGDLSGFAWDMRQNRALKFRGGLKRVRRGEAGAETPGFVFVTLDRIVISPSWWNRMIEPAAVVEFPSGKLISKLKLLPGTLSAAADPAFVIVRPYGRFNPPPSAYQIFSSGQVGMVYPYSQDGAVAVEISTGQVITSETPALDVLGRYYVAELTNGEIGLYERGKGLQAAVSFKAR